MRMDLADLRLFIAIVDSGSITGGAAMAHLALASASERVRKLEAEVGVPLLQRHARGVTLTEAGEVLARHARPLLAQQQRLRQAMSAFARGQQGTLRLFANTSAMSAFLPGKLAAWMAAHPAVQIDTEERHQRGYRQQHSGGCGAGWSGVRCGRPRAAASGSCRR
ncbi:LysR family transcriptional regulator [Klebsiella variicola]|nr:LysR family transcriptional regulator [Klebsiella variicola]